MNDYQFQPDTWIWPTPAGAYYAVSNNQAEKSRELLTNLLMLDETPQAREASLETFCPAGDIQDHLALLHRMQSLKYLQAVTESLNAPEGVVEDLVSDAIAALSVNGKSLLADDQGFYIASHGFPHETASELAAMSAQLGEIYERRRGVLHRNLRLDTAALALVDESGFSRLGFWPMYIGATRFSLVIDGFPKLNQPAFTNLVWILSRRYGGTETSTDNEAQN